MKLLLTSLIIGFLAGSSAEEKKLTKKISGKITASESYCGGEQPSREMLEQVQAPKPMRGFMVYVKKGAENKLSSPIIDSTYSNSDGEYSFNLPKGEYVLLQKNQLDKSVFEIYKTSTYIHVVIDCMKLWWEKGLTTITVENKNIKNLNFHFQKRCYTPGSIPCLTYSGPRIE